MIFLLLSRRASQSRAEEESGNGGQSCSFPTNACAWLASIGTFLKDWWGFSFKTKLLLLKAFLFDIVLNISDVGTDVRAGVLLIM